VGRGQYDDARNKRRGRSSRIGRWPAVRLLWLGLVAAAASRPAHADPDDAAVGTRAGSTDDVTRWRRSVAAALEELPVLGELDGGATRVVVRGNVRRREALRVLSEARGVYDDIYRRFASGGDPDQRPPVTLCVFASTSDYDRFVFRVFGGGPSALGFYQPAARVLVANLELGLGNVRHELVHPLIGDDFPGVIPPWLNEGMGALYGSSDVHRSRVRFLVNYRLRDLQRTIAAGAAPDLGALLDAGADTFYGRGAAVRYATARYLLLWFERRSQLEAVYHDVRDAAADRAAQRRRVLARVDARAFLAWAARLR
jgi:hypothetical protein